MDFQKLHVEALTELDGSAAGGADPSVPSPRPPPVTPKAYLRAILSRTTERLSEAGFERTPRRAPPGGSGFGRERGSAGAPLVAAAAGAEAPAAAAVAPASAPPAGRHADMRRCETSVRAQEGGGAAPQAAAESAATAVGAVPEAAAATPGGGPAAAPGRRRRHSS
jgi:hypothetical protein